MFQNASDQTLFDNLIPYLPQTFSFGYHKPFLYNFILTEATSYYARWYMFNRMIHVQWSFREFASVLSKFWSVESWFLDTMSNRINPWMIHVTANDFWPIRCWETSCILDSDWSKIICCDMYLPKIDEVRHWVFKILPPCYSRVLCTSNQRQCIERFVLVQPVWRSRCTVLWFWRSILCIFTSNKGMFQSNKLWSKLE